MGRAGGKLPNAGDNFEFYQSYPAFADFQRATNAKIVSLLQRLAAGHGRIIKNAPTAEDLEESIKEANDNILETVGNRLDEAAGVAKNETPILPGGKVSKDTVVVSSWNRQADKTRVNRQKQPQEQITKPQLLFREKPDNTSVPFVPRLFEKPHAVHPLPVQLVEINKTRHETGESLPSILKKLGKTIDLQIYSHPYEKEIPNCGVSKKQVLPEKPVEELKYMPLDESPLTMVNTVLS